MSYRVTQVRSSDGTRVAVGHGGSGYPVIIVPALFGDLQRYPWDRTPDGLRLVTADRRGTGMSELDAASNPAEVYVDDLQAVVDGLGLERFAVVGEMAGVAEALALAARNPDRASHLVLQAPSESLRDFAASPKGRGLLTALDGDWEFFVNGVFRSHNWNSTILGDFANDVIRRWNPEQCRRLIDGLMGLDPDPFVQLVDCPTLIIDVAGTTKDGRPSPSAIRTALSANPKVENVVVDAIDNPDYEEERNRLTYDFINRDSSRPEDVELSRSGSPSSHLSAETRGSTVPKGEPGDQSTPERGEDQRASLTDRELDVLRLVAAGKKNRQIAEELHVSPNTVANHVRSILAKTSSTTRTEAAAWAIRQGLAEE